LTRASIVFDESSLRNRYPVLLLMRRSGYDGGESVARCGDAPGSQHTDVAIFHACCFARLPVSVAAVYRLAQCVAACDSASKIRLLTLFLSDYSPISVLLVRGASS
jgi:hypothetical protein